TTPTDQLDRTASATAQVEVGVIDIDIHTTIPGTMDVLFPYMDAGWRKRLEPRAKHPLPAAAVKPESRAHRWASAHFLDGPGDTNRMTTFPPGGGSPGSDPGFLAEDHLDAHGIVAGLLNNNQAGSLEVLPDSDEAAVLASAINDYHLEHWTGADDR